MRPESSFVDVNGTPDVLLFLWSSRLKGELRGSGCVDTQPRRWPQGRPEPDVPHPETADYPSKAQGTGRRNHLRHRKFLRHGKGRAYRRLTSLVVVAPSHAPERHAPLPADQEPGGAVLRRDLHHPGGPARAGGPARVRTGGPRSQHRSGGGVNTIPVGFLERLLATPVWSMVRGRINAPGHRVGDRPVPVVVRLVAREEVREAPFAHREASPVALVPLSPGGDARKPGSPFPLCRTASPI